MEYTKEQVGMFIRKGREEKELTQERLSEIIGCNATYYGNIERGINYPSLGLFLRIVSYLSLSVDRFVEDKESVQTNTYHQIIQALNECTEPELQILLENAKTLIRHRPGTPKDQSKR